MLGRPPRRETDRRARDENWLRALAAGREQRFPAGEDRLGAASRVAAEHSFDVRAATLLDAAVSMWRRAR